jgi:hypothetical protein
MPLFNPSAPIDPLGTYLWLRTQDGIVAKPGGGRTGATKLNGQQCRIVSVATSGDSVVIDRPAWKNDWLTILNDGSSPVQIYAQTTDTLNGVAGVTGISLVAGAEAWLTCYTDGAWRGPVGLG